MQFKILWKPSKGRTILGISNKDGHQYVAFFDYDYDDYHSVIKEVKSLQEKHLLGHAYFFKTGRGFHVIIPNLFDYDEWVALLSETSVENEYKLLPQRNNTRSWVLRISPKGLNTVEYVACLKGYLGREVSRNFTRFLHERGVPSVDLDGLNIYSRDTKTKLTFATYEA